jgi:hypothetical protein
MLRREFQTLESFQQQQGLLLADLNAREEDRLLAADRRPPVAVLRHEKHEAADFPEGTRIWELFDQLKELTASYEAVKRDFDEVAALCARAQRTLDEADPEVMPPGRYAAIAAELELNKRRSSSVTERLCRARAALSDARQSLSAEYKGYSDSSDRLNAIGLIDRPFGNLETLSDRAEEVGEVARLEYLLAHLTGAM